VVFSLYLLSFLLITGLLATSVAQTIPRAEAGVLWWSLALGACQGGGWGVIHRDRLLNS
jgi:hypothetical protein